MATASGQVVDLDAAIDQLYAGPLEAFVGARNELAGRLRSAGDREGAARVKALGKPSLSAWAMNQLWWHERPAFEALLDAGEDVRLTQTRGAGPVEQAAAAKRRRASLTRLLQAAEGRLTGAGHASAAATLRKIGTSLEAAAAHGRAPVEPGRGRWNVDLKPPGFDVVADGFGAVTANLPPADSPVRLELAPSAGPSPGDRARARAAAVRAAAAAEVAAAAAAVDIATRAVDDATLAAQQAADALQAAQGRAEQAAQAAEAAEITFRRAAADARARQEVARAALERLHAATCALAESDAAS